MCVDVLHLVRADRCVLERTAHGPSGLRAVGTRGRHVVRVVAERVARDLGVDVRAASLGVLVLFEHEDRRPFAHHEAVALSIERPRRTVRRAVARGHRANDRERTIAELVEGASTPPQIMTSA
jgi:hypothetical protein